MINCPRCDFLQPTDRYCANCGVDIENYRPAQTPMFTRVLKNPWSALIIIIIAAAGVAFWMFTSSTKMSDQVQLLEEKSPGVAHMPPAQQATIPPSGSSFHEQEQNALNKLKDEMAANANNKPADNSGSRPMDAAETAALANNMAAANAPPPADAAAVEKTSGDAPADTVVKPTKEMHLSFYEVSMSSFKELAQKGKSLQESGETQVFSFSEEDAALFATFQNIKSLPGHRTVSFDKSNQLHYNGGPETAEEDGSQFSMKVTNTETPEKMHQLDVDFHFSWKAKKDGEVMQQHFSSSFPMNAPGAIAIFGLLPHTRVTEQDLGNFATTPLKILSSEHFTKADIENPSEFLVLVQVK